LKPTSSLIKRRGGRNVFDRLRAAVADAEARRTAASAGADAPSLEQRLADIAVADTFRLADVFSKSFAIYSRRFVPFIILTVIASIPYYLALLFIGIPNVMTMKLTTFAAATTSLALINIAASTLAAGAVMYGVVQELRGRPFSVGGSIQIALRRLLPVLGIAICSTIVMVLGWTLLLVPGLILACMYYVSTPVCVAEHAGVFTSMSRGSFLTKGYRWQVFGILLLYVVAGFAVGAIIRRAFAVTGPTAVLVARFAMWAVLNAFNSVLVGVLYYQLRVAKEGVDIDKIAGVFD
jgi:hypothetical protein